VSLVLTPYFREDKNLIYKYNFDHDILRPQGVVSNFIAAEYIFTSDLPYEYFFYSSKFKTTDVSRCSFVDVSQLDVC